MTFAKNRETKHCDALTDDAWYERLSPSPKDAAMRGDSAAHDQAAFRDREALRSFVDACQVLVGQLGESQDESTALMNQILMRVLRRAEETSSQRATTNFRVARVMRYLEDNFADPTICLASAAQHAE